MTLDDLTPDMRTALIEALENERGVLPGTDFFVGNSLIKAGLAVEVPNRNKEGELLPGWSVHLELTPAGRLCAELLKQNAEKNELLAAIRDECSWADPDKPLLDEIVDYCGDHNRTYEHKQKLIAQRNALRAELERAKDLHWRPLSELGDLEPGEYAGRDAGELWHYRFDGKQWKHPIGGYITPCPDELLCHPSGEAVRVPK